MSPQLQVAPRSRRHKHKKQSTKAVAAVALLSSSSCSWTTTQAFVSVSITTAHLRRHQNDKYDNLVPPTATTKTQLDAWKFWRRWRKGGHVDEESITDVIVAEKSDDDDEVFLPTNGDSSEIEVSPVVEECMRAKGMPLVRVVEHGLPPALQTHEMIVQGQFILTTQMEEGRLVKLQFDRMTGEISSVVQSVHMDLATMHKMEDVTTSETNNVLDDKFVGMHGLANSDLFPGHVWITLQYVNRLCLVNVESLQVVATIKCPSQLDNGDKIGGPHCLTEGKNGKLYACLKGGASCHGTVASVHEAIEADAHAIFCVDLDPHTGMSVPSTEKLFRVPPTPVMCILDQDDNCWVVTDEDGSLTMIPHDAESSSDAINVKIPYHYSLYHQTGPGLQIGPDGNPWFSVLNGEGLVGRVNRKTLKVTMFELHTQEWNPAPRICHISWDKNNILYAISSDLLDKKAVNTLFRIKFDKDFEQVIAQHELALPSQASCIHRIAHLDGLAEPSVLVSELTKSQILQVFKRNLPPMEAFPTKTFTLEVRRVYDALKPCPRTGNPVCMCEFTGDAILLPEEPEFEGQEAAFPDRETLENLATKVKHPRTGQPGWLFDQNAWGNEMWTSYPRTGYVDGINIDPYRVNGAAHPMTSANKNPGSNLGTSQTGGVLKYKPDKLLAVLKAEPSRIPLMAAEISAAGLTVDGILAEISGETTGESKSDCGCEKKKESSSTEASS